MLPEDFLKRLKEQHYINAESLSASFDDPSPVTIRINRSKWNSDPEGSEPVPWCKDAFYLKERPSFTLDPLFHGGAYYPQEASSLFLEEVFRQVSGSMKNLRVLDLCGAPGGKATHLSSLINANGLLVANEVIRARAAVLAENITKWGYPNVLVTQSDPTAFAGLPGFFDIILADAPCSGEGMFRDHSAIREWSVGNAILCSERQKRILMDVWPALREDGILIYSTCTFNPDENEKNIRWLLRQKNAETVRIDISDHQGITEIDYEGISGYGFYPGKIRGEGFFISVARKKEETCWGATGSTDKRRLFPTDAELKTAQEWSEFPEESLVRINDDIISIPLNYSDYTSLSRKLKIVKPGTKLFSVKGKDYIPSHELALSVRSRLNVFNTLNVGIEQASQFLRRENFTAGSVPYGWIMVRYNGVNLGFVKNVGTRINNYYPVEWRIKLRAIDNTADKIIKWKENSRYL